MKIKEIIVKGLFNLFDHTIKFNDKGIVIIIGENGIGKTTILEMIEKIFSRQLSFLYNVDFHEITIITSERTLTFKKNKDGIEIYDSVTDKSINLDKLLSNRFIISHDLEDTEGFERWVERRSKIFYNIDDHILRNEDFSDVYNKKYKKWIEEILDDIHVSLIKTQRIYNTDLLDRNPSEKLEYRVKSYSADLVKLLQKDNAAFASKSVELDSTFPIRLLEELKKKKKDYADAEIRSAMNKLVNYRNLLGSVGIVDSQDDQVLDKLWKKLKDENIWSILFLYIKDSQEKLDVFKKTSEKLELLLDIINSRFKHKKLIIDRQRGFIIKSDFKDQEINVEKLSSGEQNELIIFYTLLFKTNSNDLVLIDEPEISLHIAWQQRLIADLKDIAALTGASLLISTHSPDIIGSNWGLVQKLTGEE